MKIKKLIQGLPIELYKGGKDVEITGLCSHSAWAAPGNLFIAKKGTQEDGSRYIEEAVQAGAVAILTDMPNPFLKDLVQLIHPDVRAIEGQVVANFYGYPAKELLTLGITGTNGKTTTSFLIKHFFDLLGLPCGLIGTIEYIVGEQRFPADRTTPDVITNQKLLREMIKQGCKACVMEVTSHGLDQNRVSGIDFQAALFTNLSQDHLDYHQTMEAYAAAKAKIFSQLGADKMALINLEDPWSSKMIENCSAKIFSYGFAADADIRAFDLELEPTSTRFWVAYRGEKIQFSWKVIGKYNVLNALAALAYFVVSGVSLSTLSPFLETFTPPPGRLEKIENKAGYHVFVDFAHKPGALENTLACLKEIKRGKLITVFGCGGDRDKGKRPLMGKISDSLSDYTIVTSDNPRSEDPQTICQEIAAGFTSTRFHIEKDRKLAISQAIQMARPQEDVIVIAGKGHEKYQIFMHQTVPFDDRKVVEELL